MTNDEMAYPEKLFRLCWQQARDPGVLLAHLLIPGLVSLVWQNPIALVSASVLIFLGRVAWVATRVHMDLNGKIVLLVEDVEDDEIIF